MQPDPRISFVIPVRNDAVRLRRCLATIAANRYPADLVEVIVVDHGSTDGSAAVAASAGARVVSCKASSVSTLRNYGASQATGSILAFVDADHELDPGWLRTAASLFRDPSIGAAGALYHAPPGGTWVQRSYGALRGRTVGCRDVEWIGSGNLAIRRHLFDLLGGFDTLLTTCEDVDLCARLRALGHRLVGDEGLRTVHLGDPATLRALFFGELWRGRDNLRVSVRGPLSLRELPSVVVPILDLGCLAGVAAGLVWATPAALAGAVAAGGVLAGLASLRAARMAFRVEPATRPWFGQALAVALVYDVARALALVTRTPHRARAAAGR
jgi:GT2 family glycosyltransferase